jgi:dihydroorotase
MNRNALFEGGLRPHHYCLPVLKRERDRNALIEAATGDDARFFLGTDSAPHERATKEAGCGCAGIYSAHAGIELYAEAFELAGRLNRLEAFAAEQGADFYGPAIGQIVSSAPVAGAGRVSVRRGLMPLRAGRDDRGWPGMAASRAHAIAVALSSGSRRRDQWLQLVDGRALRSPQSDRITR